MTPLPPPPPRADIDPVAATTTHCSRSLADRGRRRTVAGMTGSAGLCGRVLGGPAAEY